MVAAVQLDLFEWSPSMLTQAPKECDRGISDAAKEVLYECARQAGQLGDQMLMSLSGADQADSEAYYCERRIFVAVADGVSLDEAFAAEDRHWRAYAAEQARKVNSAPKIKHGPSTGHSWIGHRWVSPEKLQYNLAQIRFMVNKALGAKEKT